ncbi:hypothetical protein [Romboutsia sp.]|uniref:hypothetical protein n=1 Tax=Romboutsia sp. TaxID=1965302 RepID=UPI003F393964
MIILSRENIIEGLIELREEEAFDNKIIITNIKDILNERKISDLEKLKMINSELSKILLI